MYIYYFACVAYMSCVISSRVLNICPSNIFNLCLAVGEWSYNVHIHKYNTRLLA